MGGRRLPGPSLFGREAEVARVVELLSRARDAESSTLLVAGPAGIGKTALVDGSLAVADVGNTVVLRGSGLPLTSLAAPFRTVRGMLRDAPTGLEPPRAGGSGAEAPVAVDPVDLDARLDQIAAHRPVVLVVDDLQWVDRESLDILRYVIAGSRTRRVGVVLTLRSEELVDGHPLHGWLADVRRLPGFDQLELAPLDRFATEQQVTGLLGAVPEAALVDEVFERSQGLPYLTRLLVADLDPSTVHLPADAPPALEDAVLASWHGLSAGARELTTVLAIAGQALVRSDLSDLVGGRIDAARVPEWTAEAVDRGVLEVDRHGRCWFHHPLQAELLEERADPDDRRTWHRACAELLRARLEQGPDPDPDPDRRASRVVAIADHYDAAGLPSEAFGWSLRVVQGVGRQYGDHHVAQALRRALELHPRVEADHPTVEELLWRLREVTWRLGDLPGELDALDALLGLPDAERRPEVVVDLRMQRAGVRYLCRRGQLPAAEEEANAILAERCPGTWQEALALARFSFSAFMRPDAVDDATLDRARRAGEEALRKARLVGDDAALAFALANASRMAYLEDDLERARELAAAGVHHALRCRDFPKFTLCVLMEGNSVGVFLSPEVRDLLLGRRRQAVELAAPHPWVAALSEHVARVSVAIGDTTTAEEMVRFSLGAPPGPLADVGVRLAATRLALLRGRTAEARQHWARVSELVEGRFDGLGDQSIRAELLSATGDHWGALRVCRDALERGADHVTLGEWLLPLAARAVADLAEEVPADDGDPSLAADARRGLEVEHPPAAAELGRPSPIPRDGSLTHPRYRRQRVAFEAWYAAELARARAAPDAPQRWRLAASTLDEAGLPWEAAYAWTRLGEAHLRAVRPDRRAAAVALREAAARAGPLEAAPLLDRVEELARSARITVSPVVEPAEPDGPPHLTPREREVLRHVIAGRTYAEIADALVVSEKTISSHISNLLRKTGTANRYELADRARRVGQRRTG